MMGNSKTVGAVSLKSTFFVSGLFIGVLGLASCSTTQTDLRCPADEMRCVDTFNSEAKSPKAAKRLALDLEDVQRLMKNTKPDTVLKDLASDIVRERLLYIQALAKIYEFRDLSKSDSKSLEKFFDEMKEVEGLAGDYSRRWALTNQSKKGGAPQNQIDIMERERVQEEAKANKRLEELGWRPDPIGRMNQLMRDVAQIDFGSRKEEQQATVDGVRELAKEQRKRIETLSDIIALDAYTEKDLEKGLHTLRRCVRWVLQSMLAAEGQFRMTDFVAPKDAEVNTEYGKSKYVRMSEMNGVKPTEVTRRAVLDMAKLVTELGLVKDFKEFELDYSVFLLNHGFAANERLALEASHDLTVRAFGKDVQAEKVGHQLYKYYREQDPLKVLIKDLKD